MEVYAIIGAICVVALGWYVQLVGLSWEPVALALAVLGVGFAPRIKRSIKSRQGSKIESQAIQLFQTFLGGDELLKELERVEATCARLSGSLVASGGQNVNPLIMELDHLWLALTELKGKYRGLWTLSLQNKVTMVANQLREASSALGGRKLEHMRAHIDGAVQNAKSLITSLETKQPP
ncbi:hypothetical protein MUP79_03105 [Candidatus Bathyarchaeota archaeon]|nr:hypothetical protein [Candidatus Bathyarchaeota archaeon]